MEGAMFISAVEITEMIELVLPFYICITLIYNIYTSNFWYVAQHIHLIHRCIS